MRRAILLKSLPLLAATGRLPMQAWAEIKLTQSQAWNQAIEKSGWTPALLTGPAFGKFVDEELSGLRGLMGRVGMV